MIGFDETRANDDENADLAIRPIAGNARGDAAYKAMLGDRRQRDGRAVLILVGMLAAIFVLILAGWTVLHHSAQHAGLGIALLRSLA